MTRTQRYLIGGGLVAALALPNVFMLGAPYTREVPAYAYIGYQMGQASLLALWCVLGSQQMWLRLLLTVLPLLGLMLFGVLIHDDQELFRLLFVFLAIMPIALTFAITAFLLGAARLLGRWIIIRPADFQVKRRRQFDIRALLSLTFLAAVSITAFRLAGLSQYLQVPWGELLSFVGIICYFSAFAVIASVPMAWLILSARLRRFHAALILTAAAWMLWLPISYWISHLLDELISDWTSQLLYLAIMCGVAAAPTIVCMLVLRWLGYLMLREGTDSPSFASDKDSQVPVPVSEDLT